MYFRKSCYSRHYLILLSLLLFLQGCTNEYAQLLQQEHAVTSHRLKQLEAQLQSGNLSNAELIKNYAKSLKEIKPELSLVSETMAQDATSQGILYQNLLRRLNAISLEPENRAYYDSASLELRSLNAGSDPVVFNDALIDIANTLADLSDGELPRVEIPRNVETAYVKGSQGVVPGSYLIGNPSYGEFRQDGSSDKSLWHWYGQYAFFSSLFSGPSYYRGQIYDTDWYGRNRYSYHRDYGRSTYGSSYDRQRTKEIDNRLVSKGTSVPKPKKEYGSVKGKQRVSTYTTMRKDYLQKSGVKYGAGESGPRHSNTPSKRDSSLFSGNRSGTSHSTTNVYNRTSSTTTPKRSSSLFGSTSSSSRSSSRSSGGRSRGGK